MRSFPPTDPKIESTEIVQCGMIAHSYRFGVDLIEFHVALLDVCSAVVNVVFVHGRAEAGELTPEK